VVVLLVEAPDRESPSRQVVQEGQAGMAAETAARR
jgi:hypothetical protein